MAITLPEVTIVAKADFFLFFSGVQAGNNLGASAGVHDQAKGGTRLSAGDLPKLITQQRGLQLLTIGWFGSVKHTRGIDDAFDLLNGNSRYAAGVSRLVIYGHSAGAANALDLCRRLDKAKPEVKIDLLVTVDAALQEKTNSIKREAADCVLQNVNFWQNAGTIANLLDWSRGGENSGKCKPDNRQITGKHTFMNTEGKIVTEEVSHSNIDQITWPTAVNLINNKLKNG